jgi:hypothetical protein
MRYLLGLFLVLTAFVSLSRQPAEAASCHPSLTGITLASASIPGGASDIARVTLSCTAPTGVTVGLHGFTGVSVPATVTVARGKTATTATVRSAVTMVTRRGVVAATLGRVRRTAPLTVTKTPKSCNTPALAGMTLVNLAYVGDHPVATISLSCAPLTPIRLKLTSSNANVPVPATVTVGRFYDYAKVPLAPKANEAGQYTATITAGYGGKSLSRTLTVDPGLSSVAISPVIDFPDQFSFEVFTTGIVPAGGETVTLKSSDPAVTVPATYTVPASSVGAEVTGITINQVTKDTKVTLSATLGSVTKSASYVLVPPFDGDSDDTVTIANQNGPGPVYGANPSNPYQVVLGNPAPDSGETFTVVSGNTALVVDGNPQGISAGGEIAIFNVETANVTAPVHTTLSVTVGGLHASVPVTIEPTLSSFTNFPASVTGGSSFTMTLNMMGPVDTPTVVDLQSTSGIATVPLSVTVPRGQSSVSFTVTTSSVTSPDQVSIVAFILANSATLAQIQSPNITINP